VWKGQIIIGERVKPLTETREDLLSSLAEKTTVWSLDKLSKQAAVGGG